VHFDSYLDERRPSESASEQEGVLIRKNEGVETQEENSQSKNKPQQIASEITVTEEMKRKHI
jgi:hypothetical protein